MIDRWRVMNKQSSLRSYFLLFTQFYSQDSVLPIGFSTTASIVMGSFTLMSSTWTSHTFFTASRYREIPSRKMKEMGFLQPYWYRLRDDCWSSHTHSLQAPSYGSVEVPKPLYDRLLFCSCVLPVLCAELFQLGRKFCFTQHDLQYASHCCGNISSWEKSIPNQATSLPALQYLQAVVTELICPPTIFFIFLLCNVQVINCFQANFLLNLHCHSGLADCEHQKAALAQAGFLLGYHQGAEQDL